MLTEFSSAGGICFVDASCPEASHPDFCVAFDIFPPRLRMSRASMLDWRKANPYDLRPRLTGAAWVVRIS